MEVIQSQLLIIKLNTKWFFSWTVFTLFHTFTIVKLHLQWKRDAVPLFLLVVRLDAP